MLSARCLSHHLISFSLLLSCTGCLLASCFSYCAEMDLQSFSIRARVSEDTMLGKDAPEDFEAYDVSLNFDLPWKNYSMSGWGIGTNLMASSGILRGAGKNALVVSLTPELILGTEDRRFIVDLGAGGALFSRHRFGTQDYGGPFQFVLTVGVAVPLYKKLRLGYRFLHYSDAGVNGSDTIGADFHMIMFIYRF
ncbi:acyloxyacyl hydrolase [Thalassotalea psychrophila]|uniref:Acyloxyacyl hydrolase n=1 Tax=Thalassotalea psychrophila TaxID=3065647 RepID=A0ABY9TXC3_9GAMM|nr:acyloxyacyl hydrolase [Colwelliaceae bacterium SQ149]